MPIFSLLYTTARPSLAEGVLSSWEARSGLSHEEFVDQVETIITMDAGFEGGLDAVHAVMPWVKTYVNEGAKNCVAGWNLAAAKSTGQVLMTISDDHVPPVGWFQSLLDLKPAGWMDREAVVGFSDGLSPDLLTLSFLTRKRYERFGYVFYISYESLFCDTEYTAVAVADGVVIDARHLLFEHRHYSASKRPKDRVDESHAGSARWARGEATFNARRRAGFPKDEGSVAEARMAGPLRMAAVVQAIKDDFCLYEVCDRLLSEPSDENHSLNRLFIFVPDKYWSGRLAPKEDSDQVRDIAQRLAEKYGNGRVTAYSFEVGKVTHWDQSRIMVETACRNWYSSVLLKEGYEHVIVLDGDEVWKKGLLARLAEYVRWNGPDSVYTGMVPVAGLPGYPIQGALDKATIYLNANRLLAECRGAYGHRHELPGNDVYHFTATRRTVDEIVQKHMESGHKDDPRYQMEAWCANVLKAGKIVPGYRNAHMYEAGRGSVNVWPLVRAWLPVEMQDLPESVRPFLGKP